MISGKPMDHLLSASGSGSGSDPKDHEALRDDFRRLVEGSHDKYKASDDGEPDGGGIHREVIDCHEFRGVLYALLRFPADIAGGLSEREMQICWLAGRGLSNKQIANRTGLSIDTVRANLRSIFKKTGVEGRSELVRVAMVIDLTKRIALRKSPTTTTTRRQPSGSSI